MAGEEGSVVNSMQVEPVLKNWPGTQFGISFGWSTQQEKSSTLDHQ